LQDTPDIDVQEVKNCPPLSMVNLAIPKPEEAEALLENDGRQWPNEEPTTELMSLPDLR